MSEAIRLRANAKVNLLLRVLGTDDQGWHRLESIFHSVALADTLELRPAPPGTIEVEILTLPSQEDYLPAPGKDLVTLAASQLADLAPSPMGASITVTKRIPIGAGLAGGSADAAAALIGLDQLWELRLSRDVCRTIGGSLGSDVAFCLQGGTALGTGRGDELTALEPSGPFWFVLGLADGPLLTKDVYAAWDRTGWSAALSVGDMVEALEAGDAGAVAERLHNDLCDPALTLRPEIERGLSALLAAGAPGVSMSGSGPTVFALTGSEGDARDLSRRVAGDFARVEVVSSTPRGVERAR